MCDSFLDTHGLFGGRGGGGGACAPNPLPYGSGTGIVKEYIQW